MESVWYLTELIRWKIVRCLIGYLLEISLDHWLKALFKSMRKQDQLQIVAFHK